MPITRPSREQYVEKIKATPIQLWAWWATDTCPECGERNPVDVDHVKVGRLIAVACEGYWVINPNAVGIPTAVWDDWTKHNFD